MTNHDPRSGAAAQHPANPSAYPMSTAPPPPGSYPTYAPQWYSPPPAPRRRSATQRTMFGLGVGALAAALVVGGVGIGREAAGPGLALPGVGQSDTGNDGTQGGGSSGQGSGTGPGNGYFPNGSGSTQSGGTTASSTQQKGIVTIVSTLGYQSAAAAGTGMILTSDGEVLTNNHVISGATSVKVTVESTDKTYTADVVGTSPSSDVAVLQLRDASGLTTAQVGDAGDVSDATVGSSVTAVGNANGTGTLTVAKGTVTDLEKSITASDEGGTNAERLTGLIETNAPIVSGDSGGPLYDSDGDIIGINTAASVTNGTGSGAASQAYAVPIDDALQVVKQIDSGTETSSVHIGLPAFIGVGVSDAQTGGAGITSVLEGGPADDAGITAGSTITSVGGKSVTTGTQLKTRLGDYKPGEKVAITWTDPSGQQRTATVTLTTGPAD